MDHHARQKSLVSMLDGCLIVASAHDAMQMSGDMAAPFLQDANFLWLTGITLPGWKIIIEGSSGKATLVRPSRSNVQIIFDGVVDETQLLQRSRANTIIDDIDFESTLRKLARHHQLVYTPYKITQHAFVPNPAAGDLHALLSRIFAKVTDCSSQISELRAIKSTEEIDVIRDAVQLTIRAFNAVYKQFDTYRHEYEIEADMTQIFRRANAKHAYEPIVANGENAVTLHYVENSGTIKKNKLTVIDVGARVKGYSADITRTYCRHPTKRQVEVHTAVESAHRQIIALLGPNVLVAEYIARVDTIMKEALSKLGLLTDLGDDATYRKYFPHAVSHGLGVDTHDSLGAPRYFRPGMVLTVEPGIYIPEEEIGVRIEDDILITENGNENLSRGLPTAL